MASRTLRSYTARGSAVILYISGSFLSGPAFAQMAASQARQLSSPELVAKTLALGRSSLLLRTSFYEENSLQHFCSCKQTGRADYPTGVRYYMSSNPDDLQSWNSGFPARAVIGITHLTSEGSVTEAFIYINFQGASTLLTFRNITHILGPGWSEDQKAELNHFMAAAREPFNHVVRAPRIVSYDCADKRLYLTCRLDLDFGDSDQLGLASLYMTKLAKPPT